MGEKQPGLTSSCPWLLLVSFPVMYERPPRWLKKELKICNKARCAKCKNSIERKLPAVLFNGNVGPIVVTCPYWRWVITQKFSFLGTVIAAGADFRPQLFSIMDIASIYILLKENYLFNNKNAYLLCCLTGKVFFGNHCLHGWMSGFATVIWQN